jgi:hypothetical protein
MNMQKFIYLTLTVCIVSAAQAQTCNPNIVRTAPDSRYELVMGSGGSEVLDKQTGLIWQRCSLGQTWNGTACTGAASTHTWTEALAKAKAVGNGYRLPNIRELKSLTEKACFEPAINSTFFPNTVSEGYWSASPDAGYNTYAWVVGFGGGNAGGSGKNGNYYVRAVRAGQ